MAPTDEIPSKRKLYRVDYQPVEMDDALGAMAPLPGEDSLTKRGRGGNEEVVTIYDDDVLDLGWMMDSDECV